MKANEFVKKFGWTGAQLAVKGLLPMREDMPVFDYCSNELKQLVRSYELIQSLGGLYSAKHDHLQRLQKINLWAPNNWMRSNTDALAKAILDVESCM